MNLRSCCHFNASGVFSPSEGGSDVLSLPLSLSLSVFTCLWRKNKKMCECNYEIHVCVCEIGRLLCLYHVCDMCVKKVFVCQ